VFKRGGNGPAHKGKGGSLRGAGIEEGTSSLSKGHFIRSAWGV